VDIVYTKTDYEVEDTRAARLQASRRLAAFVRRAMGYRCIGGCTRSMAAANG